MRPVPLEAAGDYLSLIPVVFHHQNPMFLCISITMNDRRRASAEIRIGRIRQSFGRIRIPPDGIFPLTEAQKF